METSISVAMATFNGANYLLEQLNSIANQNQSPYELVVCDDGSTDGTQDIVARFAQTTSFPVKLYKNEKNLGYANNFLKAVGLCSGEWIALSDQDDVWHREKLSTVSQTISNCNSDDLVLVCHSADLVNEDLSPTGRRFPDFKNDALIMRGSHFGFWQMHGFALIFKKDLVIPYKCTKRPHSMLPPYNREISHDQWICLLANSVGDVAYISTSMAYYRRHAAAITGPQFETTFSTKIRHSLAVGAEDYQYQSSAASDSAKVLREICRLEESKIKKNRLLVAAQSFEALSNILNLRWQLYAARNLLEKCKILFVLARRKGYFGSKFFSLGMLAFLKDFICCLGIFRP